MKRVILITLMAVFILFSFTGCASDEPCEGEIINKEFFEEYTVIQMHPVTIYNGSTVTTTIIPYTYHYPDRWRLTVQWYADNSFHEKQIYVTQACYEAVNIGDWFVYDEEFCSYIEPCEKSRGK